MMTKDKEQRTNYGASLTRRSKSVKRASAQAVEGRVHFEESQRTRALFIRLLQQAKARSFSPRVVFNIKGNDYRLVVAIDYRRQIVFIKWIGSHADYDQIDAKTVSYGN